jgi:hypothetical protein
VIMAGVLVRDETEDSFVWENGGISERWLWFCFDRAHPPSDDGDQPGGA